ncbi:hypothetical protein M407DRAFT_140275 [Tulasnella calospora MUT 4182]|uniref:Uncharacterized protein n=1 Tax=Tulasnella calospora MUT 4182 TaxID=1051891 RepID=A0A0C3PY66_9AGAM|nr:hypothetical protein M407DRAFT_140275 [Tulasnella calospora MUT 4182]
MRRRELQVTKKSERLPPEILGKSPPVLKSGYHRKIKKRGINWYNDKSHNAFPWREGCLLEN